MDGGIGFGSYLVVGVFVFSVIGMCLFGVEYVGYVFNVGGN